MKGPPLAPRRRTLTIAGVTTAALSLTLVFLPVPYVVEMPGPTVDVLGEADGTELIQVPEAPSHPVTGQLRLTTVSTRGSGQDLTQTEALIAWLSPTYQVIPYEAAYPKTSTREEREQHSAQQMTSSQESASVAALDALGIGSEMKVVEAVAPSAAAVLKPDDVLLRLNGVNLEDFDHLLGELAGIPAGSSIEVEVRRDGAERRVTMVTEDDGVGGSRMGITVGFALPIDLVFGVEGIGGSSAGLMFALGIVDKLGPADLADGHIVAGTGTIDPEGNVGPIGGIQQKMLGAARDGAELFLAPADNCPEVRGNVPEGLRAVRVATLSEALEALVAMRAGRTDSLATCG